MIRLTKERKLAVLRRTRQLLKRPYGWTRRTWKSPYHAPGRSYHAYCLEGACNQAAIDVLGKEAAIELGAAHPSAYSIEGAALSLSGSFARRLSLAAQVERKLAERGVRVGYGDDPVPIFNDDGQTRKRDVIELLDEYIRALEAA